MGKYWAHASNIVIKSGFKTRLIFIDQFYSLRVVVWVFDHEMWSCGSMISLTLLLLHSTTFLHVLLGKFEMFYTFTPRSYAKKYRSNLCEQNFYVRLFEELKTRKITLRFLTFSVRVWLLHVYWIFGGKITKSNKVLNCWNENQMKEMYMYMIKATI